MSNFSKAMLIKPHFSVKVYKTYFKYLSTYFPQINLERLLLEIGLEPKYFETEENWVSVYFDFLFMTEIARLTGDSQIAFKVGQYGVTRDGLGPALYSLGQFAFSLDYIYHNLWRLGKFLNKVVEQRVEVIGTSHIRVILTLVNTEMDSSESKLLEAAFPHIVQNIHGYYSAFPTLKRMGMSEVKVTRSGSRAMLDVRYPREKSSRALVLPAAIFMIVMSISFYLHVPISEALSLSFCSLISTILLFTRANLKNASSIVKETEKNLRKLDEQYQDLFKTKTHLQRKLTESDAINRVTQNLSRFTSEKEILDSTCGDISKVLGLDRSLIMLRDKRNEFLEFKAGHFEDHTLLGMLQNLKLSVDVSSDDPTKISNVYRFKKPILIADVKSHLPTLNPESQQVLQASGSKSFLAVPIATDAESFGVIMADMVRDHQSLTQEDLELLAVIGKQLAITLAKNRATHEIEEQATSYSRFVPWDLIRLLGAQKIKEIDTGKGVELDLTIVFCDIRGFTSMSEKMSPADSVKFLNSYYTNLAPTFQEHGGVIDKFLGDGIMALFESPSDALRASAEYQRKLADYNEKHRSGGKRSFIKTGFGIHSGKVLLGAIGYKDRLSISVVSDSVNLASRLDGLTKKFGVDVVCTENVLSGPEFTDQTRKIAELKVEGRDSITQIYEFFAHLKPEEQQQRRAAAPTIENILKLLSEEQFEQALQLTEKAVQDFPNDPVVQHYRKRLLAQFVNIEFKIDAA